MFNLLLDLKKVGFFEMKILNNKWQIKDENNSCLQWIKDEKIIWWDSITKDTKMMIVLTRLIGNENGRRIAHQQFLLRKLANKISKWKVNLDF
jgi:hypothetical protein